ncbi:hypothetical protein GE09DRAFT_1230992 [Coniochaeta sp. 2T2.1]|nr:hypothetical protein GE09DRAFT_1230992 [Coniochaeta sp. 2T2.1]
MWFTPIIFASLWASFPIGAIADADLADASVKLFSEICIAWHLSPSTADSKGGWYWDDNHELDDCVSVDDHGQLTHFTGQGMSGQCFECNSNDGWGHTSSLDHTLTCNCSASVNNQMTVVRSSIDLNQVYSYQQDSIYCGSHSTKTPAVAAQQPNDASPASTWTPSPSPTPGYSNGQPGNQAFSAHCNSRFHVAGNSPHAATPGPDLPHVPAFNPMVMWVECADEQGVWMNTSLDLGKCFGSCHGSLIVSDAGLLENECYDCVQDLGTTAPTLLCHCQNDYVFNKSTTWNATAIPIEPTIEVINGTLSCFGHLGERGPDVTPPASLDIVLPSAQLATRTSEELKRASEQLAGDLAPDAHNGFYDTCDHHITLRWPEPWMYAYCRRNHDEHPKQRTRYDLNRTVMHDINDWSLKLGSGIADSILNGECFACQLDGSSFSCNCTIPGCCNNRTRKYIDLNSHIANVNGTLCSNTSCGDHHGPMAPITGPGSW